MQLIKKKFEKGLKVKRGKCLNRLLVVKGKKTLSVVTNAVNLQHALRGHQKPNRFIITKNMKS